MGPTCLSPRSSNSPCGASASLSPRLTACSASYVGGPTTLTALSRSLTVEQRPLVARVGAQPRQPLGQAADRRRVRAAVVVDHDDELPVLAGGDVVQRLPGHAAGQRAVAHDRHDVPVLPLQGVGLGQAVGVGQRGGGVGVLDRVVVGLGPAGVAGQAALLPQPVELARAAGEHLVHVRLVAGVEQDAVARRVEHPVQGERQLDDAEVGAEVAAVRRHRGDDGDADLLGELGQLGRVEVAEVVRPLEVVEQTHAGSLRRPRSSKPRV